jgi:hypothetical protein
MKDKSKMRGTSLTGCGWVCFFIIALIVFFTCKLCSSHAQCWTAKQARQVRTQQTIGQCLIVPGVLFTFHAVQEARPWTINWTINSSEKSFLAGFTLIGIGAFLNGTGTPLDLNVELNTDINPYYLLDQEIVLFAQLDKFSLQYVFEYFPPEDYYCNSLGLGYRMIQYKKWFLELGGRVGIADDNFTGVIYFKETFELWRRLSATLYQRVCSNIRNDYIETRIGIQYKLLN